MTTPENPATEIVEAPEPEKVEPQEVKPEPQEEDFDKDRAMKTIHQLREIEKQAKKDAKELEQLKAEKKQREDAELSEAERLKKENAELKAQNAKATADLLRREIIAETGLPATFADRLKGETREELLADAEELAKNLPQLKTAPKLPQSNPANPDKRETDAQKRERLFGKQGNPFDLDNVKEKGGGVFIN